MSNEDERKMEMERIKRWIEDRRRAMEQSKESKDPEKLDEQKGDEDSGDKDSEPIDVKEIQPNREEDKKEEIEINPQYTLPKEVIDQIRFEKERISRFSQSTADYARAKLRLDYLERIPWIQEPFKPIDVKVAREILESEHYGMESVKDEVIEYIYALNKMGRVSNETLVLSGPPGTGKTTIARQIAKALGREFVKIPLGGLADEVFLRGSTTQYSSSKPGAIADALYQIGHRRLVILLDEIDKLSTRHTNSDGASALLDVLDQDSFFLDRFINIPISMKDIIFIATANEISSIPPALYDRMTCIEIKPYTKNEKLEICKKFILPKVIEAYGLQGRLRIEEKVISQIVEEDINNAGIRGVDKKLRKLCKIAARFTEENNRKFYSMTYKRAVENGIILKTHVHYINDYSVGKVVTSAMNPAAGKETLICIESLFAENLKSPELLGVKKAFYQDDLTQLTSFMVCKRANYYLSENFFQSGSFVINIHDLALFKYDENHRLPMFMAMYSTVRNVILPRNHVAIGDVTLLGEVKSNYMTQQHIMNALNRGATVFFVPADIDEELETLLTQRKIATIKVSHLLDLWGTFGYLEVLNQINEKINKNHKKQQEPIDKLVKLYKSIHEIETEKGWTFKESLDYYFSDQKETFHSDAVEELSRLIGLGNIKKTVQNIVNWKSYTKKRIDSGYASKNIGLHMIFTGNPGTGKTTVAKLLGKMLYEKKLTKTNRFVEVTRDDLVGKYVGHTEDRVKSVIKRALGGVLYIDEAHSLFVETENDYGRIVISTLVKEMEENRENLIIIMSGYQAEMSEMIRVNPGLKDRINFKVDFSDYSRDELVEIFYALCKEEAFHVPEDGKLELERIFEVELMNKQRGSRNFSNGRSVRNLYEKAKIQQAIRLVDKEVLGDEDFGYLLVEDILSAYQEETSYREREEGGWQMGFTG